MSQARTVFPWRWKEGLGATLLHVTVGLLGLAAEHLFLNQFLQGLVSAAGPSIFFAYGIWSMFREVRCPRFWSRWWRAQVLFFSYLAVNLIFSAVLFSLRPAVELGEFMLWLIPVMWIPCLWPVVWSVHLIMRRAS